MERIVLHASPRHLQRKLALNLVVLASGAVLLALDLVRWLGWALVALGGGYSLGLLGLPSLYLTLVGTDGDPHAIAQVISRRVQGPGHAPGKEITGAG